MGVLSATVEKEFRAVAPVWLAAVGAALVAAASADSRLTLLAVGALTIGSAATGAQAMGYEYAHRTLGLLLAQPAPRMQQLAIKVTVLAVLLGALVSVAALAMNVHAEYLQRSGWLSRETIVLALLYGLFVAPWMTLVSRSVLGGIVFTASFPGILILAGMVYGGRVYGPDAAAEIDQMRLVFLWRGSLALAAVSAVAGWWQFMRLEAIEGHADLVLWRWRPSRAGTARDGARARHPAWMLFRKELRLQQLTFVVAGLYVVSCTLAVALRTEDAAHTFRWLLPVTMVYLTILAVLAGAVASAEERQAGTIQWQQLLPVPFRLQWGIKVGTVLGLALTLAVALPMALMWFAGSVLDVPADVLGRIRGTQVVLVLWLACLALYLSSISSSGVRALVLMAPVGAALAFVGPHAYTLAARVAVWIAVPMASLLGIRRWDVPGSAMLLVPLVCSVGLATTAMLHFAARNHRLADAPPVVRQAGLIALAATIGILAANVVLALLYGTWMLRWAA